MIETRTVLNDQATLELLNLFKNFKEGDHLKDIGEKIGLTERQVKYQRKKYKAYSDYQIDLAIKKIENRVNGGIEEFPRDYQKQATCSHSEIKIFLKCSCTLCLSEKNLDEVIGILEGIRSKRSGNIVEQVI